MTYLQIAERQAPALASKAVQLELNVQIGQLRDQISHLKQRMDDFRQRIERLEKAPDRASKETLQRYEKERRVLVKKLYIRYEKERDFPKGSCIFSSSDMAPTNPQAREIALAKDLQSRRRGLAPDENSFRSNKKQRMA